MFFEIFVEKLEKSEKVLDKKYIFGLEFKNKLIQTILGATMFLIGVVSFLGKLTTNLWLQLFTVFVLISGVQLIFKAYSYKVVLDSEKLVTKEVEVYFDKVEKCKIKEMFMGKKMSIVLDIITDEKVQYILPLNMNKKLEFASMVKNRLGNKFSIEKD